MVALFVLAAALCNGTPLTDWKTAHAHARDHTVQLRVPGVVSPKSGRFHVYLQDGLDRLHVASSAVYPAGLEKSNYLYDLRSVLKKLASPPSDAARIVLVGWDGEEVEHGKPEVSLPK